MLLSSSGAGGAFVGDMSTVCGPDAALTTDGTPACDVIIETLGCEAEMSRPSGREGSDEADTRLSRALPPPPRMSLLLLLRRSFSLQPTITHQPSAHNLLQHLVLHVIRSIFTHQQRETFMLKTHALKNYRRAGVPFQKLDLQVNMSVETLLLKVTHHPLRDIPFKF